MITSFESYGIPCTIEPATNEFILAGKEYMDKYFSTELYHTYKNDDNNNDSLAQSIEMENINAFNDEAGVSKISLIEYQEQDGVVKTAIQYSDIASYNSFNMMDITLALYDSSEADEILKEELASAQDATPVVQTAPEDINEEELLEAGYSMEDIEEIESGSMDLEGTATETDAIATFTDAATLSTVNSDEIEGASYMMLITDEPYVYSVNGGKILYYNKHAELVDSSTIKADGVGKTIVIYEFNY
jgi:hypothetical protein